MDYYRLRLVLWITVDYYRLLSINNYYRKGEIVSIIIDYYNFRFLLITIYYYRPGYNSRQMY
jgi:hypothetical protein